MAPEGCLADGPDRVGQHRRGFSTFRIALEAQARGHHAVLLHAGPAGLCRRPGHGARLADRGAAREGQPCHLSAKRPRSIWASYDVVWLRQDPPFDMGYITTTHLLEMIHPQDAGGERSVLGAQLARRSCWSCAFPT